MRKLSIVIPALNEEKAIGFTLDLIPRDKLKAAGWDVEVLVVDNASRDKTAEIARSKGARVVNESVRGYGRAYKSGINAMSGGIFCVGDADGTYPFDRLPEFLELMDRENLDFLTTDRFALLDPKTMPLLNRTGNRILSILVRTLFGVPLSDSQSGMWLCRKALWDRLHIRSDGMAFSQEFKIDAVFYERCRWREIPISYRIRIGPPKLNAWRDGFLNLCSLVRKRIVRG